MDIHFTIKMREELHHNISIYYFNLSPDTRGFHFLLSFFVILMQSELFILLQKERKNSKNFSVKMQQLIKRGLKLHKFLDGEIEQLRFTAHCKLRNLHVMLFLIPFINKVLTALNKTCASLPTLFT